MTGRWRHCHRLVTAVVIGGGQSGLATSRELVLRGIEHVVLERGEVANAWRTERWDSLRLLTPNWQTVMPGHAYDGDDPDGFMTASQVADFISACADRYGAPVQPGTRVVSVSRREHGYLVRTNRGDWVCRAVVLASGYCNRPTAPAISTAVPSRIAQLTPQQYRNPAQLASGGVLVVGASASGVQIARELQCAGHQVTLAAGEHLRLPRTYRGRDIQYWMHATGLLDEDYRSGDDINRVRGLPSPQLLGDPARVDVDLNALSGLGVKIVGRLVAIQDSHAQFSGSLANVTKMSDLKQARLLRSIDAWIRDNGVDAEPASTAILSPTRLDSPPRLSMALGSGEINTIVWATGYRPDYSWLQVPVIDRKGRLQHDGGVTAAPGLFAIGLPFMRRRKSGFLFGTAEDASDIASAVARQLHSDRRHGAVGLAAALT